MDADKLRKQASPEAETDSSLSENQHMRVAEILESISEGVAAFDREWKYTYVNQMALEVIGLPRNEVLGKRLSDIYPGWADSSFAAAHLKAMNERVSVFLPSIYYAPLNAWFENRIDPIPGGVCIYFKEVTEEKRVNDELKIKAEVLASMTEGVSISDVNGIITYTNPAEDSMFGYSPGELIGKHVMVLNAYPAEENVAIVAEVIDQLTHRGAWSGEWQNIKKDGTAFATFARITRIQMGAQSFFVCVQEDITARKRREANVAFVGKVQTDLIRAVPTDEMLGSIGAAVVQHLGLLRCLFVRIDQGRRTANVFFDYHQLNIPSLLGVYALRDFHTPAEQEQLAKGVPLVINDVDDGSRSGEAVNRFSTLGIRALVTVPYVVNGQWRFAISAQRQTPYRWGSDEVSALQDLAERLYLRLDRVHTEDALREREARFRTLADSVPVHIWMNDGDDIAVFANARYLEYVGATEETFSHYHWPMVIHPDDRQRYLSLYNSAKAASKEYEVEARLCRHDGSYRLFHVIGSPRFEGGRFVGYVGINLDITERGRAEEALRDSDERFRVLSNNIPSLAWMANADGWIFWYNQRWYAYTGTTLEEMQGWGWAKVHHPDHLDRVTEIWKDNLARGEQWEDTFPLRGTDGRYRWFLSRASPVRDVEGKITRWFGTNTDVTELQETRDALSEANALLSHKASELESVVEQRTTKLRETIAELEAFSYSIAHDLRAPLRSMQGMSKILSRDYTDILDSDGQRYLNRIATASERMDRLIQDVLSYSRILRSDLPSEPVDVERLLGEMLETYPNFFPDLVDISVVGALPHVRGNKAMLTQIFSNLIGNAVKFVPPGIKPQVRISAVGRETQVRINVADNGIGIPHNEHQRIFEIFHRVGSGPDGTGIGLAIVKKSIERMSGKVGVESEPGAGSTFWIELPRA